MHICVRPDLSFLQINGAAQLGDMLKVNQTLQSLCLSEASIGDAGAVALASGLKTNVALRLLALSHNRIGSTGAAALAGALQRAEVSGAATCPLARLELSHNFVADAGAAAMAPALSCAHTLRELILCDCDIGPSGALHSACDAMAYVGFHIDYHRLPP